jgi:hypothetical protein
MPATEVGRGVNLGICAAVLVQTAFSVEDPAGGPVDCWHEHTPVRVVTIAPINKSLALIIMLPFKYLLNKTTL